MVRRIVGVASCVAVVAIAATVHAGAALGTTSGAAPILRVMGTQIVDGSGTPIQLGGVDRSGTEYACVQGWGIFDGPSDQASISAMATWHVHIVRVPLNEDCWLAINGVNPAYSGGPYRRAIAGFVHLLEQNGMNVILELHFNAPGTQLATGQQRMPDADHSPAFWRSVAKWFGQDEAVLFDLYNEPHDVSWGCWLHGCTVPEGWKAVGMQGLVNAVRNAGAQNILMAGGLGWAGDLTQWGAHMPSDPLGQLVASWHNYNFGSCITQACWSGNAAGVGGKAPILFGELGETGCGHSYVDALMSWADSQGTVGIGYLAWTWDAWPTCDGPTLILDYTGTPTTYGQGVHDHFVVRFPPP